MPNMDKKPKDLFGCKRVTTMFRAVESGFTQYNFPTTLIHKLTFYIFLPECHSSWFQTPFGSLNSSSQQTNKPFLSPHSMQQNGQPEIVQKTCRTDVQPTEPFSRTRPSAEAAGDVEQRYSVNSNRVVKNQGPE